MYTEVTIILLRSEFFERVVKRAVDMSLSIKSGTGARIMLEVENRAAVGRFPLVEFLQ